MTRSMRLVIPALVLVVAVPAARAQGTGDAGTTGIARVETPADVDRTALPTAPEAKPVVNAAGPRRETAAVGVRTLRNTEGTPASPPKRVDSRQNKAMMIVGFSALIVGAVIDKPAGTIIMIGGAGLGLWGLYRYLE